jgi:hypothetical protein
MTLYKFTPPTLEYSPPDPQGERLWLYFRMTVGITILKAQDGSYSEHSYVSQDAMREAAACYLGGHEYHVDEPEAIALGVAGYLDYLDPNPNLPPTDPPGFGDGGFGTGGFGT